MPRSFLLKKYYPRNDERDIFPLLELSSCISRSLKVVNDTPSQLLASPDHVKWNYEYEKSYWFDTSNAIVPYRKNSSNEDYDREDTAKEDTIEKDELPNTSINNIKSFIATMIRPVSTQESRTSSPLSLTVNLPRPSSNQEDNKQKDAPSERSENSDNNEEEHDMEKIRKFLENNRVLFEDFAQEIGIDESFLNDFVDLKCDIPTKERQELHQWYTEKILRIPKKAQQEDESYTCHKCGKIFTYKSYLERHIKYVCPDSTGRTWKCNYCGKAFQYPCYLRRHVRSHTGESPYKCDKCDRAFVRSTDLQRHIRNHTGEKPYSCSQCSRAFARSTDLKRHMRTHTGEKPYKCWKCGKSFSQSGSLQTHVHTHAKEQTVAKSPAKKKT